MSRKKPFKPRRTLGPAGVGAPCPDPIMFAAEAAANAVLSPFPCAYAVTLVGEFGVQGFTSFPQTELAIQLIACASLGSDREWEESPLFELAMKAALAVREATGLENLIILGSTVSGEVVISGTDPDCIPGEMLCEYWATIAKHKPRLVEVHKV